MADDYDWDEPSTRAAVGGRSGGICEYCQQQRATDKHHRISRGVRGRWTPANIVDLCWRCHGHATREPTWARSCGLVLKSWEDPESIAVTRQDGTVFQPTSDVTGPAPRRTHRATRKRNG